MRCKSSFLIHIFLLLLAIFLVGRIGFVAYNAELGPHSLGDFLQIWLQGLKQDFVTILYLLSPFALFTLIAFRWKKIPLRWMMLPYALTMGAVVGSVVVFDAVMYKYWQFKLGAVMLAYAASPEGATNSVSPWYIVTVVGSAVVLSLLVGILTVCLTPKRPTSPKRDGITAFALLLLALFACCVYNGGMVFHPLRSLFVNHAATNPVYNFCQSFHVGVALHERYHAMPTAESDSITSALYPHGDNTLTDTLLRTQRPDVLLVMMESFGGQFVKELGGEPDVAPNLSRLIPEGIWWEKYYSSSCRTDRGTVSLLSGTLSHPDVSLMKETQFHPRLSSLPRSLQQSGYHTLSLMGQPMTNMGKSTYLQNMGLETLDYTYFAPEERQAAWGAHDGVSAQKAVHIISQKDSADHLFLFYQTISSHEPWDVPYHRLSDPVLNAFAYTDQAIGDMVDSLRRLPQWDNLLVIILPDHGYLYQQTYETPEFFHAPMLWLGGAIRQPRSMDVLINQSDVAATLLAQMNITNDDFRFSRNVLGHQYTNPFVYCNYPAGFLWHDSTGISIHDLPANKPILQTTTTDSERTHKGKAVMQATYQALRD